LGIRSKGHASSDEISPTLQTRRKKGDNIKYTKYGESIKNVKRWRSNRIMYKVYLKTEYF
jgi:hypothetical protein